MEDNVQYIFIFLISVVLLFIFPVYVAYEKKDDIAYSLALRYTQTFVNEVSEKGYLTKEDYNSYLTKLAKTDTLYEVKMEHRYRKASPKEENDKNSYVYDTEIFNTKHILNIINSDKVDKYQMNEGDSFEVTIKNTNTTLATVMYNIVTLQGSDTNTRIYVDCDGTIANEKWREQEAYVVADENISRKLLYNRASNKIDIEYNTAEVTLEDNKQYIQTYTKYTTDTNQYEIPDNIESYIIKYVIGKNEGIEANKNDLVIDIQGIGKKVTNTYWFINSTSNGTLNVAMGINGIEVCIKEDTGYTSILAYTEELIEGQVIELVVDNNNNTVTLYVNGKYIMESKEQKTILKLDESKIMTAFWVKVKDFEIFTTSKQEEE